MDDDYDEDFELYDDDEILPGPLDWRQFVGSALIGAESAIGEVMGVVGAWGRFLIGAKLHDEDERAVHAQMTAELEQMTGGQ